MTRRHFLVVALVLSVSLNLLVAGAALGRWLHRPQPLDWAIAPLDSRTRESLRPLLQQRAGEAREIRRTLREGQRRLRVLMDQEPLDKAALAAELAALRDATVDYQAAMHSAAVQVLAQLPPEQRRRVARQLLAPSPPQPVPPPAP